MRNCDYYKTPAELAAAFAKLSNRWCCYPCSQCPVAPTNVSKKAVCSTRFAYAEYIPENLPIPAWLNTNTPLLGKTSGKIFDILEIKSDATAVAVRFKLHSDGFLLEERTESFSDASAILNFYTPVTLEKVTT